VILFFWPTRASSPNHTLSQTALFDLAQNFIRQQLTTEPGAQLPYGYGGGARQVQIDLDQKALHSHDLSAELCKHFVELLPRG